MTSAVDFLASPVSCCVHCSSSLPHLLSPVVFEEFFYILVLLSSLCFHYAMPNLVLALAHAHVHVFALYNVHTCFLWHCSHKGSIQLTQCTSLAVHSHASRAIRARVMSATLKAAALTIAFTCGTYEGAWLAKKKRMLLIFMSTRIT